MKKYTPQQSLIRVEIRRISADDDLAAVAASVVGSEWGKDNEQDDYSESALGEIVARPDYILLIAYVDNKPAGLALAMKLLKPSGEHWLYVDELDAHPSYRRKSIATKLMLQLFNYAKKWKLDEVWLGTEPDNVAANHLYKSLRPSKIENFVGYTFKPQSKE